MNNKNLSVNNTYLPGRREIITLCQAVAILRSMMVAICLVLHPVVVAAANTLPELISSADLSRMSLEKLTSIEIFSVSRKLERLGDSPAAVYVIAQDDIRRSGATSIPEILRLARAT